MQTCFKCGLAFDTAPRYGYGGPYACCCWFLAYLVYRESITAISLSAGLVRLGCCVNAFNYKSSKLVIASDKTVLSRLLQENTLL